MSGASAYRDGASHRRRPFRCSTACVRGYSALLLIRPNRLVRGLDHPGRFFQNTGGGARLGQMPVTAQHRPYESTSFKPLRISSRRFFAFLLVTVFVCTTGTKLSRQQHAFYVDCCRCSVKLGMFP
jgi:hypothetical protein